MVAVRSTSWWLAAVIGSAAWPLLLPTSSGPLPRTMAPSAIAIAGVLPEISDSATGHLKPTCPTEPTRPPQHFSGTAPLPTTESNAPPNAHPTTDRNPDEIHTNKDLTCLRQPPTFQHGPTRSLDESRSNPSDPDVKPISSFSQETFSPYAAMLQTVQVFLPMACTRLSGPHAGACRAALAMTILPTVKATTNRRADPKYKIPRTRGATAGTQEAEPEEPPPTNSEAGPAVAPPPTAGADTAQDAGMLKDEDLVECGEADAPPSDADLLDGVDLDGPDARAQVAKHGQEEAPPDAPLESTLPTTSTDSEGNLKPRDEEKPTPEEPLNEPPTSLPQASDPPANPAQPGVDPPPQHPPEPTPPVTPPPEQGPEPNGPQPVSPAPTQTEETNHLHALAANLMPQPAPEISLATIASLMSMMQQQLITIKKDNEQLKDQITRGEHIRPTTAQDEQHQTMMALQASVSTAKADAGAAAPSAGYETARGGIAGCSTDPPSSSQQSQDSTEPSGTPQSKPQSPSYSPLSSGDEKPPNKNEGQQGAKRGPDTTASGNPPKGPRVAPPSIDQLPSSTAGKQPMGGGSTWGSCTITAPPQNAAASMPPTNPTPGGGWGANPIPPHVPPPVLTAWGQVVTAPPGTSLSGQTQTAQSGWGQSATEPPSTTPSNQDQTAPEGGPEATQHPQNQIQGLSLAAQAQLDILLNTPWLTGHITVPHPPPAPEDFLDQYSVRPQGRAELINVVHGLPLGFTPPEDQGNWSPMEPDIIPFASYADPLIVLGLQILFTTAYMDMDNIGCASIFPNPFTHDIRDLYRSRSDSSNPHTWKEKMWYPITRLFKTNQCPIERLQQMNIDARLIPRVLQCLRTIARYIAEHQLSYRDVRTALLRAIYTIQCKIKKKKGLMYPLVRNFRPPPPDSDDRPDPPPGGSRGGGRGGHGGGHSHHSGKGGRGSSRGGPQGGSYGRSRAIAPSPPSTSPKPTTAWPASFTRGQPIGLRSAAAVLSHAMFQNRKPPRGARRYPFRTHRGGINYWYPVEWGDDGPPMASDTEDADYPQDSSYNRRWQRSEQSHTGGGSSYSHERDSRNQGRRERHAPPSRQEDYPDSDEERRRRRRQKQRKISRSSSQESPARDRRSIKDTPPENFKEAFASFMELMQQSQKPPKGPTRGEAQSSESAPSAPHAEAAQVSPEQPGDLPKDEPKPMEVEVKQEVKAPPPMDAITNKIRASISSTSSQPIDRSLTQAMDPQVHNASDRSVLANTLNFIDNFPYAAGGTVKTLFTMPFDYHKVFPVTVRTAKRTAKGSRYLALPKTNDGQPRIGIGDSNEWGLYLQGVSGQPHAFYEHRLPAILFIAAFYVTRETPPSTLCLNCYLHHGDAPCPDAPRPWEEIIAAAGQLPCNDPRYFDFPQCPRCHKIHPPRHTPCQQA